MKKFIFIYIFLLSSVSYGADRYWIGDSGNWNNTAEWSTTSAGAGGSSVPSTSDTAYVDAASLSAASTITINVAASVINLIVTGLDQSLTITMSQNLTCSGTCQIDGQNSTTGRVLVKSNTLGTSRTITAATVSMSNIDLQDITGAGAGSWDLSAITGGSGNAGGNTNIIFTTAATQTWSGASGGNWSANAWTTRVPLPQDDVVIASAFSASQTVTADMPRLGESIDFTGVSGSPAINNNTGNTLYGSLTLASGLGTVLFTSGLFAFEGRGSFTLTSAGKDFIGGGLQMNVQMVGGTLTLQDAFNIGSNQLNINNGTFDANNFNATVSIISTSNSNTRATTMGSGTWTLSGTGTVWNATTATNLTVTPNTSTISITDTSATAKTFAGGGKTYNNLTWAGGSSAVTDTTTGSNTFNTLSVGGITTMKFTDSTYNTVQAFVTVTPGNKTLTGTGTAGWFLVDTTGTNAVDSCTISYSTVSGGATWNAYTSNGNVDGGNNSTPADGISGWDFTAPAVGGRRRQFIIIQ